MDENIMPVDVITMKSIEIESIENTGYQMGYTIGVPIWVIQKASFIKMVDKADKVYQLKILGTKWGSYLGTPKNQLLKLIKTNSN